MGNRSSDIKKQNVNNGPSFEFNFNSILEYLKYFVSGYIYLNKFEPQLNIPNDILTLIILFYGSYVCSFDGNVKQNYSNINALSLTTKAEKELSADLVKVISTFPVNQGKLKNGINIKITPKIDEPKLIIKTKNWFPVVAIKNYYGGGGGNGGNGGNDDEMDLKEDEVYIVIETSGYKSGWWHVQTPNGDQDGWIPSNDVQTFYGSVGMGIISNCNGWHEASDVNRGGLLFFESAKEGYAYCLDGYHLKRIINGKVKSNNDDHT